VAEAVRTCGSPADSRPERVDLWVARAVEQQLVEGGVAQRLRIMARLLTPATVSGEELATSLKVSRAAVHKHIEHLREMGYSVSSSRGAGYRLSRPHDSLAPEAVLPALLSKIDPGMVGHMPLGLPYNYREELASTNDSVKALAQAGAPGGAVTVVETQTAGRGRMDRVWVSERRQDVTFSYLLRPAIPPARLHMVVLAAAAAIAETLEGCPELAGHVGLKWPNDVLLDGRKVCGILAEGSLDMDTVHWVAVGVGLNVNSMPGEDQAIEPSASGIRPTSLRQELGTEISRAALLADALAAISVRTAQLLDGEERLVLSLFSARDFLRGRRVSVRSGAPPHAVTVEGHSEGLGEMGELLVRTDEGKVRRVLIGEATSLS
jgi:BirA family transcriptional regulator, biotin operon repressor / biotin---[acetyl-CoA-carboxylase] ligase